jgi:dipeptidyl aminopeptidase/acylaminoacyl peptidase
MLVRIRASHIAALTSLAATATALTAQPVRSVTTDTTPLIPIESLFSAPVAADDAISPDGKWLSFLKPWRGRLNLYVQPIGSKLARRVTSDSRRSIPQYWWSLDGSRLLYLQDTGGDEQYHLMSAAVTGARSVVDLTPYRNVEVALVSLPARATNTAVITMNRRDPRLADAYRVDLRSGALELAAENSGVMLGYVSDENGSVRIAYAVDSLGRYSLLARNAAGVPWRTVRRYAADVRIAPLRFHPDGERLYALSNAARNLSALVLVDLSSGGETVVHEDPLGEADSDAPVFDAMTGELLLTSYTTDTARFYPQTQDARAALADISARLPAASMSVGSISHDRAQWVLTESAPHQSARTWLYDRASRQLAPLHEYRPSLQRYTLARSEPIGILSRDGLMLRGYLTKPTAGSSAPYPLVVSVHGGPWDRDRWQFQGDVQLLANRGYAVLQLNYRGSTGFGKAFARAAKHEFAGRMHDDLLDGIRMAIDTRVADSSRIAILGGSYGGYAALVGLTFTPRRFRCAVDYAGSSNLITLLEAFPPSWQPFLPRSWYPLVGDPRDSTDRADLTRRSPLFRADSAIAPLLIFQGANDPRVTQAQSDAIATALTRRGIPVTYLLAAAEGHSFGEAQTSLAVNRATEQFLGQCLGGRVQRRVPEPVERALQAMRVNVQALSRARR